MLCSIIRRILLDKDYPEKKWYKDIFKRGNGFTRDNSKPICNNFANFSGLSLLRLCSLRVQSRKRITYSWDYYRQWLTGNPFYGFREVRFSKYWKFCDSWRAYKFGKSPRQGKIPNKKRNKMLRKNKNKINFPKRV